MSQESATKSDWLTRAKETYRFHARKKKENKKWLIADSAKALKRSLGSICEDLKIASWFKTHPTKLEKFDYAKDALEWIRSKEDEIDVDFLDE